VLCKDLSFVIIDPNEPKRSVEKRTGRSEVQEDLNMFAIPWLAFVAMVLKVLAGRAGW
jgi:hypothetical protein